MDRVEFSCVFNQAVGCQYRSLGQVGGLQIQRTLAEVDAVRADVNPLHEQCTMRGCSAGEEFAPERIEPLQRFTRVSFLDVAERFTPTYTPPPSRFTARYVRLMLRDQTQFEGLASGAMGPSGLSLRRQENLCYKPPHQGSDLETCERPRPTPPSPSRTHQP